MVVKITNETLGKALESAAHDDFYLQEVQRTDEARAALSHPDHQQYQSTLDYSIEANLRQLQLRIAIEALAEETELSPRAIFTDIKKGVLSLPQDFLSVSILQGEKMNLLDVVDDFNDLRTNVDQPTEYAAEVVSQRPKTRHTDKVLADRGRAAGEPERTH